MVTTGDHSLEPDCMTAEERLGEVAAILATGYLRLRCRRGYLPDTPAAPHATSHEPVDSGPENVAGIPRN